MRSPGTDGGLRASPAREDVGSPPTSLQPLRAFPREALDHMFVLQFDGGSRGNPGNSGAGAAISRCETDVFLNPVGEFRHCACLHNC